MTRSPGRLARCRGYRKGLKGDYTMRSEITRSVSERIIQISEITRGLVADMRQDTIHTIIADVPSDSIAVIRDIAKIDGWRAEFAETTAGWSKASLTRVTA